MIKKIILLIMIIPVFGYGQDANIFGLMGAPHFNSDRMKTRSMRIHPYVMLIDKINGLDKRDFQGLIELIIEDFPAVWWRTNLYDNNMVSIYKNHEIQLDFVTGDENRIVAIAHSPLKGDTRFVINIDKWEKLNNFQRVWLFLHELGHEYFGLKHGSMKLMYPLMPEEDLTMDFDYLKSLGYSEQSIKEKLYPKYTLNHFSGNIYLGKGVKVENFSYYNTKISFAFAVLWEAVDEFFDEIFSDVEGQINYDNDYIKSYEKKYNYLIRNYTTERRGETFKNYQIKLIDF